MFVMLASTAIGLASTATTAPRGVAAAVQAIRKDRQVLRFFGNHGWLLTDPRFAAAARRQITVHRKSLVVAERYLATHHKRVSQKQTTRRLAAAQIETPATTICRVFGEDCSEAIQVARCESHLRTDAQNGQYLGLFQMGMQERRLFGHGNTAEIQARAARRYFLVSGRDWSPWSCKPY
jgi:hypothetical protein